MSKRRRTPRSLWIDALQRNRSAQKLRRSAQRNQTFGDSHTRQTHTPSLNIRRTDQPAVQVTLPTEGFPKCTGHDSDTKSSPLLADLQFGELIHPESPCGPISSASCTSAPPSRVEASECNDPTFTTGIDRDHASERVELEHTHRTRERYPADPDLDPAIDRGRDVEENEGGDDEFQGNPEIQPFEADEFEHRSMLVRNDIDGEDTRSVVPDGTSRTSSVMQTPQGSNGTGNVNHTVTPQGNEYVHEDSEGSVIGDFDLMDISLQHLLQIWSSERNLTAIVAIVGSVRYTVQQYEYTRDMLRDAGADPTWPPYATAQRYFQRIIETCMPKSEIVKLPKTSYVTRSNPSQREHTTSDTEDASPDLEDSSEPVTPNLETGATEKVRIFLPSSWAKLDVVTSVVFDEMYPYFQDDRRTPPPLDRSAIIRNKEHITNSCNHIFVNTGTEVKCCRDGTALKIFVQNEQPSCPHSFQIDISSNEAYVLHASVVATWSVGSEHRCSPSAEKV